MHLLHDFLWSIQQGKLHELFLKDPVAFATWGLVVATFLLLLDSLKKGGEQQKRWTREDQLRSESQRPQYDFGLNVHLKSSYSGSTGIFLWCANLGSASFIVKWVRIVPFSTTGPKLTDKHFEPNVLVSVGSKVEISVPFSELEEFTFGRDIEVAIRVSSSSTLVPSDPKFFNLQVFEEGRPHGVREGLYEPRQVDCPACGSTGIYKPDGATCREVVTAVVHASRDLERSCPNHQSNHLISITDKEGSTTRLR